MQLISKRMKMTKSKGKRSGNIEISSTFFILHFFLYIIFIQFPYCWITINSPGHYIWVNFPNWRMGQMHWDSPKSWIFYKFSAPSATKIGSFRSLQTRLFGGGVAPFGQGPPHYLGSESSKNKILFLLLLYNSHYLYLFRFLSTLSVEFKPIILDWACIHVNIIPFKSWQWNKSKLWSGHVYTSNALLVSTMDIYGEILKEIIGRV